MLTDLKEIRLKRGLTQLELSRMSGVSTTTISEIEKGKKVPKISTVCLLAKGLSINSVYLFELLVSDEVFNNDNNIN